jgi:hypothetical protein
MAFVNEYVSEEDDKKYGLEVIDERYFKGHALGYTNWTRDRERDIYLRFMRDGGEEERNKKTFVLFWKGTLIEVVLDFVRNEKTVQGSKTKVWAMRGMDAPWWEKNQEVRALTHKVLEENRAQIISDLKEAMIIYQDAGVYSLSLDFNVLFEF